MRRVGVLLCGCGVYDGSDVQEAVLLAAALARRGLVPVFLAPDRVQDAVIDHGAGLADAGAAPRRILTESARVARGRVRPLAEVRAGELGALVIPGGMGVVRGLCRDGGAGLGSGEVLPELGVLLQDLEARGAPVGVVGLARVVLKRSRAEPLDLEGALTEPGVLVADTAGRTLYVSGFLGGDSLAAVATGIDAMVQVIADRIGGGGDAR
jgi:enhancing lycopene biosynthesis protein 2